MLLKNEMRLGLAMFLVAALALAFTIIYFFPGVIYEERPLVVCSDGTEHEVNETITDEQAFKLCNPGVQYNNYNTYDNYINN